MNCREAKRQIIAERDGTLVSSQSAALEAHLGACAECRQFHDQLTSGVSAWQADAKTVRVPNPDFEWQKIRRELHRAPGDRRRVIGWFAVPLAAAAAIMVGVYVVPTKTASLATHDTGAVVKLETAAATEAPATSTIVYVDDRSGWTFVLADDGNGQHI